MREIYTEEARYVANVAYTLAQRRLLFDHRFFAVADFVQDLAEQLCKPLPKYKRILKLTGILFVFTRQGAQ